MRRLSTSNPEVQEILSARGIAASAMLDMSPFDVHSEILGALEDGSVAAKNLVNASGFDDEVRGLEKEKGQEVVIDQVLPDSIQDPFEGLMQAGADKIQAAAAQSPFAMSTELPELAMKAMIGF